MAVLLQARGLEKAFSTDDVARPVLRGLSLEVERGEWVAAMGPSGCGKSTMLHLLGGLDLPDAGSVLLGDDDVTAMDAAGRARLRRRRVGYVFQQYNLIPHLDVAANVELPQRLAGASRRAARTRSIELLAALGLDPTRALLFRQSDVPEVTELAWLLATVTGMGLLERAHSYKDKLANGITPSVGLFFYPVLMAADILAYDATLVPVGKDQVQHIEMAQDMATHFNETFGAQDPVLVRPEPLPAKAAVVRAGLGAGRLPGPGARGSSSPNSDHVGARW